MRRAHIARERGFALLIVLWALVLLTLLFTQLVSAGRSEADRAGFVHASADAEAAADAAVYQAIFHLLDSSPAQWRADGATHIVTLSDARASVVITDLAGQVNPNTVSAALLSALLHELGTEKTTADDIAAAVVAWRAPDDQTRFGAARYAAARLPYAPAGSAFQSIDELGLVIGMSRPLLDLLAPHLSLFNPDNPDPALSDPVVLRAMRDIDMDITPRRNGNDRRDIEITAFVVNQMGARFVRRATVRFRSDVPFAIMTWERSPWPNAG